MNKTDIEWCDYTWNPVTGCKYGCRYCYAIKNARRFNKGCFEPKAYTRRMYQPQRVKQASTVFVCSMGELFGDWVPYEWIKAVFEGCSTAPQHRYIFLTKNPERYIDLYTRGLISQRMNNCWFGTTITEGNQAIWYGAFNNNLVCIEPIHGPVPSENISVCADWVIIGAETGNDKDKVIPERAWIEDIVEPCKRRGVPVFMKNSLRKLMGSDFLQEFPWEHDSKEADKNFFKRTGTRQ